MSQKLQPVSVTNDLLFTDLIFYFFSRFCLPFSLNQRCSGPICLTCQQSARFPVSKVSYATQQRVRLIAKQQILLALNECALFAALNALQPQNIATTPRCLKLQLQGGLSWKSAHFIQIAPLRNVRIVAASSFWFRITICKSLIMDLCIFR